MKKLLTILFLFFAYLSSGQDAKPVDANLKVLQSPNNPIFYYNTADSTIGLWKGNYTYNKFFSAKHIQHLIDSLAYQSDAPIYEIEVSVTGTTSYTLPWTLRSNSLVFYNGSILPNAKWQGIGTIYFTVSGHVLIKDVIKIKR